MKQPHSFGDFLSFQVLTQTLEMRENFQKQLQEIMSATSIVKPQGQRGSLSRNSFDNSPSTPDSTRSMRNGRSRVLEALRYFVLLFFSLMVLKMWIANEIKSISDNLSNRSCHIVATNVS